MLKYLKIQNFALIDEQTIEFEKGLNVLTGETGSGKSILINALCFALGSRADKTLIRSGCDFAKVEAIFETISVEAVNILKEFGIDYDDELIITRKMNLDGKNEIRVNGNAITLAMLKEITSNIVDVYGQFEHSVFLDDGKHVSLLDNYCNKELEPVISNYRAQLFDLNKLKSMKLQYGGDNLQRLQKKEFLQYQISEIENLNLKVNDDTEIKEKINYMQNFERIKNNLSFVNQNLCSENGVIAQLNKSYNALSQIQSFNNDLLQLTDRLKSTVIELDDISSVVIDLNNACEFDQNEYDKLDSRLDQINLVKKKYGNTIDDVLQFLQNAKKEYDFLDNSEAEMQKIDSKIDEQTILLQKLSQNLTDIRKKYAIDFERKIIENLSDLGMVNSQFKVDFEKLNTFSENGTDKIQFLFSANLGEPLKFLSKIISGGEMSRFCLAQKCVLNEQSPNITMIFDEIDTGVSGVMGQEIAKKLAKISIQNQVISISHLPQIAGMADTHFRITKNNDNSKTISSIMKISSEESLKEIARLAGGETISQYSIAHAQDIKIWANLEKEKLKK